MTLYQFNASTEVGKAEILWELGVLPDGDKSRRQNFAPMELSKTLPAMIVNVCLQSSQR